MQTRGCRRRTVAFATLLAQSALAQRIPAPPPAPIARREARALYLRKCSSCHGDDGRGQTSKGRKLQAPDFTSPKWAKETSEQKNAAAIAGGVRREDGTVIMPAFRDLLARDEIDALVSYVRAFSPAPK